MNSENQIPRLVSSPQLVLNYSTSPSVIFTIILIVLFTHAGFLIWLFTMTPTQAPIPKPKERIVVQTIELQNRIPVMPITSTISSTPAKEELNREIALESLKASSVTTAAKRPSPEPKEPIVQETVQPIVEIIEQPKLKPEPKKEQAKEEKPLQIEEAPKIEEPPQKQVPSKKQELKTEELPKTPPKKEELSKAPPKKEELKKEPPPKKVEPKNVVKDKSPESKKPVEKAVDQKPKSTPVISKPKPKPEPLKKTTKTEPNKSSTVKKKEVVKKEPPKKDISKKADSKPSKTVPVTSVKNTVQDNIQAKKDAENKEREKYERAQKQAQEVEKQRQTAIKAAAEKQRTLLQNAKESIAKLDKSHHNFTASEPTSVTLPASINSLHIDALPTATPGTVFSTHEKSYVTELVGRLKLSLRLPEYGDIKVRLTLERSGTFSKMAILSAASQINKKYIEKTLPNLKFPPFGENFKGEMHYTFEIHLSSDD